MPRSLAPAHAAASNEPPQQFIHVKQARSADRGLGMTATNEVEYSCRRIMKGMNISARVITCSDAASRGERVDRSGPAVRAILAAAGFDVDRIDVHPDHRDSIRDAIVRAIDADGIRLVVTTGGTGIAPTDVTPEATAEAGEKRIDGFGELMRMTSLKVTRTAALSRAAAWTRHSALIVNLPGSVRGAEENLAAVLDLIPHALELLAGSPVETHPDIPSAENK